MAKSGNKDRPQSKKARKDGEKGPEHHESDADTEDNAHFTDALDSSAEGISAKQRIDRKNENAEEALRIKNEAIDKAFLAAREKVCTQKLQDKETKE